MKILLLTLEYPPHYGGIANYYYNLAKYWPEGELKVLHNNENQLVSEKLPIVKWLPAFIALYRAIKREKIDYVLVGQILPLGTVALIVCKMLGIKYALILHGMDLSFAFKKGRKKKLAKIILKNSDKIICGNSYTAKIATMIMQNIADHKISVVHPGIEELKLSSEAENKKLITEYGLAGKQVMLTLGRLVKRKGVDMVLQALPNILNEVPNLVYVIIGRGPEEQIIRNKINSLGLQKKVIFLTQVTDSQKQAWYNICNIFIMPSRNINGDYEGFGIVFLEANMAGKPVIAGDSGGIGDAVIDGYNGLMVKGDSVEQIKRTVIRLVNDEELQIKLGTQGKIRAQNEFNWPKQVNKFYNDINNNSAV